MADSISVAVCDDHAVVVAGLRALLSAAPDLEVVGDAGSVAGALELAERLEPDVFVMDLNLPDGTGFEATQAIRELSPQTRVVILTVNDDVAYVRRAFDLGVAGYLIKDAADVELIGAVRQVASGSRYVHPRLGAELLDASGSGDTVGGPGGRLSAREVDVLTLLAQGFTNSQVADRLYVSVRTIETHRAHIQQKLGIKGRSGLVRFALETGLIDHHVNEAEPRVARPRPRSVDHHPDDP